MNLLDHRQSNAVCRHINAMWRMRGVGGARVHRGERGFVIEGGARTTDMTTPDSFDGDKEVRQFLLTRVQKLLPGSIGGAYNDWSDQAGVIDATKVVRCALENAVSVSGVLLLTEATMIDVEDESPGQVTVSAPELI